MLFNVYLTTDSLVITDVYSPWTLPLLSKGNIKTRFYTFMVSAMIQMFTLKMLAFIY